MRLNNTDFVRIVFVFLGSSRGRFTVSWKAQLAFVCVQVWKKGLGDVGKKIPFAPETDVLFLDIFPNLLLFKNVHFPYFIQ